MLSEMLGKYRYFPESKESTGPFQILRQYTCLLKADYGTDAFQNPIKLQMASEIKGKYRKYRKFKESPFSVKYLT